MERILQLRQERGKAVADARAILDKAEIEKRALDQEEQNAWDGLMAQADGLRQRIEREERQADLDREMGENAYRSEREDPTGEGGNERYEFQSRSLRAMAAQPGALAGLQRRMTPAYQRGFNTVLANGMQWAGLRGDEARALQADSDPAGGYLYAPLQFVDRLIKAVDDAVFIRQWATIYPVADSESLGFPSLETDPADADWTSELATGNLDSGMAFGRREMKPSPLAKRIKISRKLLRKVPSAETLVGDRLAYKFGITWEKAALTGSGANQPLGVFTASANGISTGRDVSTGNTTTAITLDGLTEAKFKVKGQYWPRSRWLFHRDAVKMVAKLKDANGQYLWRESTRAGEPDRILGMPVFMSEYAPNTFTTGLYVGIFGDFSNYWIADSLNFEVQRLVELYAEANQIGLIGRMESDGMPVMEEAFARVKLA